MIMDSIKVNEGVVPNIREIAILKEHFPSCFHGDGTFDLERFKEFLSDKIAVTCEGYELKFLGKNYARLLAALDTTTVIVPDEEHNSKPENKNSKNLYISGDNLDGLKHLLKSYSRKIKCIYIDPPYNTGTDGFVYKDKFDFSIEEISNRLDISSEQAQRLLGFLKRNSASHSAWLMFMYPRLQLARDLMSQDGVIIISIDDNEYQNLKFICDDIFGEENFISSLVWSAGRKNDSTFISNSHEYMLLYFRDKAYMVEKGISWRTRKDGLDDIYAQYERLKRKYENDYPAMQIQLRKWYSSLEDNIAAKRHRHYKCIDENGIYFPSDISWPGGGGPKYEVIHPITGKPCKVPERGWVFPTIDRMNEMISKGIIHFGPDENTVPCIKTYLKDNEFEVPYSVFYKDGRAATKRLKTLLGEGIFTNPKDEEILSDILRYTSDNDSIILDFFAGSASTAHAVFLRNIADSDSHRQFIMIQLQENLDEKLLEVSTSEDRSAIKVVIDFLDKANHPHTIDWIGIERLKKIRNELITSNPDITADLGFKHFSLSDITEKTLDKLEKFDPNDEGLFTDNNLLNCFGKSTVLTTWLIRDGYGLSTNADEVNFAGYKGYYLDKHLYLIEPELSDKAIEAIVLKYETDGRFNPENVIVFGYSFTWTELEDLQTNLGHLRDTDKNLRINIDIRY